MPNKNNACVDRFRAKHKIRQMNVPETVYRKVKVYAARHGVIIPVALARMLGCAAK